MTDSFEIELCGVRIYARHGVFEQERTVGNEFVVDVKVSIPVSDGARNDELAGTISYADLYACVSREMSRPSRLLEHVAVRIGSSLQAEYPEIISGSVRIEKVSPPISGISGSAAVKYCF